MATTTDHTSVPHSQTRTISSQHKMSKKKLSHFSHLNAAKISLNDLHQMQNSGVMSINSPCDSKSTHDGITIEFTKPELTKNGVPHAQSNTNIGYLSSMY